MASVSTISELMAESGNACSSPSHGVVILDGEFRTIAIDPGAAAILASLEGYGNGERVQDSILRRLECQSVEDGDGASLRITPGGRQYRCRIFVVRGAAGGEPMLTLYIKRDPCPADAVRQIAVDYRLTEREQQALIGLFMGLTSKEIAAKMNISTNTVKAFVRLAMIKTGVSSRAHLFAKLLGQTG